jgi:hypothetical protein
MIKKVLLISIAVLYAGTASAEITLLSKNKSGSVATICVEGYVVVVKSTAMLQLLDSDGDPLTCKGEVHEMINK